MPSDLESQEPKGHSSYRIATLFFSRLLIVLLTLMFLDNSVIVFAQSVPTQIPSMVVAIPWLTAIWFVLAITLVAIATIYVVFFDSHSSVLVSFLSHGRDPPAHIVLQSFRSNRPRYMRQLHRQVPAQWRSSTVARMAVLDRSWSHPGLGCQSTVQQRRRPRSTSSPQA